MKHEQCSRCSRSVPAYDLSHISSDGKNLGTACGRCWAEMLSEKWGTPVGAVEIDPISMTDLVGKSHTFHFRFDPAYRVVRAFELENDVPGGYQFAVRPDDDDPEEPVVSLLGRLIARMRRALALPQIQPSSVVYGGYSLVGDSVRGRIDYDPRRDHDPSVPVIVLDGRTFTWEEFGAMLMTFEGWDFRISMLDAGDDEDEPRYPSDPPADTLPPRLAR